MMPNAKNYAVQSAAVSDLGLGDSLASAQAEMANKLKKKKLNGQASEDLGMAASSIGFGGAGSSALFG